MDPQYALSDARLMSALAKVELAQLIRSSSSGLETHIRDLALSAGQRQLLALAIALLRRRKGRGRGVLVLDEATSNTDRETEMLIRRVVRTEFAGWTVVEVTHRVQSVLDADVVAVMQAGRMVEFGSPKEVMSRLGV